MAQLLKELSKTEKAITQMEITKLSIKKLLLRKDQKKNLLLSRFLMIMNGNLMKIFMLNYMTLLPVKLILKKIAKQL